MVRKSRWHLPSRGERARSSKTMSLYSNRRRNQTNTFGLRKNKCILRNKIMPLRLRVPRAIEPKTKPNQSNQTDQINNTTSKDIKNQFKIKITIKTNQTETNRTNINSTQTENPLTFKWLNIGPCLDSTILRIHHDHQSQNLKTTYCSDA